MKKSIQSDVIRICGSYSKKNFLKLFFKNKNFRLLFYYRKCYNNKKSIFRIFYHFAYKKNTIELPLKVQLGDGALFLHPYNITINENCKIGKNLTILKGATIGNTKDSNGNSLTPIIGDNVYIGLNSTIVGGITIGNDVLIAANSFVNFDVPDHSVVIGNPGIIHSKKDATKNYIINAIK